MLLNRKGMSIIQVLVGLAIAGVLGTVMTTIFLNSLKSSNYVSAKYDNSELLSSINRTVIRREYCPTAFNSGSGAAATVITIPSAGAAPGAVYNVDVILQDIAGTKVILAEKGKKYGQHLLIDSMNLTTVAVEANKPTAGQTTHHMKLNIVSGQTSGFGASQFANTPLALTIVTNSSTGAIEGCESISGGGAGAVIWSRTISSPLYPIANIEIPEGTKGVKIDATSLMAIQLPGDKGRTIGTRYNYTTDGGQSGTFAVSEIGAGNNNGAQARLVATTTGVIPVLPTDTRLTISRVSYVLNEVGAPMSAPSGTIFSGMSLTLMGLDKAPESPPPPPPPIGPSGPGGPGPGDPGDPGGCFVAGTEIQMADGSTKNIESIQVGDQVLSFDESKKLPISRMVTKLHHHEAQSQRIHEFKMENGEKIVSNAVHPFFVIEQNAYFHASEIAQMINAGAQISFRRADGANLKVSSLVVQKEVVPVFNFEVEGLAAYDYEQGSFGRGHNYFANGFLVHNAIYGSGLGKTLNMMIMGVPSYGIAKQPF